MLNLCEIYFSSIEEKTQYIFPKIYWKGFYRVPLVIVMTDYFNDVSYLH